MKIEKTREKIMNLRSVKEANKFLLQMESAVKSTLGHRIKIRTGKLVIKSSSDTIEVSRQNTTGLPKNPKEAATPKLPTEKLLEHNQLTSGYDKIKDLHDGLDVLILFKNTIESKFMDSFKKESEDLLKRSEALRKKAHNLIVKSLESLKDIAKNQRPKEFAKFSNSIKKYIETKIDKEAYEKLTVTFYAYPHHDSVENTDNVYYSEYFILHNMKNNDGFKFKEFCIIFSAIMDSKPRYYLTISEEFRIPGSHHLGIMIKDPTSESITKTLGSLLAAERVQSLLKKYSIHLTTQEMADIQAISPVITKIDVSNGILDIHFAKKHGDEVLSGDKKTVLVTKAYVAAVSALKHASNMEKGVAFPYRIDEEGSDIVLKISKAKIAGSEDRTVPLDALEELIEKSNLDPRQVQDLRKMVRRI